MQQPVVLPELQQLLALQHVNPFEAHRQIDIFDVSEDEEEVQWHLLQGHAVEDLVQEQHKGLHMGSKLSPNLLALELIHITWLLQHIPDDPEMPLLSE